MRAVNAVTSSWAGLHVDRPSFAAVAEAELDAVHRYLLFLTGNRAVAEDLTGETFEKAFRSWRRFDPRRGSKRRHERNAFSNVSPVRSSATARLPVRKSR